MDFGAFLSNQLKSAKQGWSDLLTNAINKIQNKPLVSSRQADDISQMGVNLPAGYDTSLGHPMIPTREYMQQTYPQRQVMSAENDFGASLASSLPVSTPVPTPAPQPVISSPSNSNYMFDYSQIKRPRTTNFQPTQPPEYIGKILRDVFPNEATKAATIANTETWSWNPKALNQGNGPGQGVDRGLFQINSNTFGGLLINKLKELQKAGVTNFEQMDDPLLNAKVAKVILDSYGPGRWFGWQDQGYDLNNGYYSAPKVLKQLGY